MDNMYTQSLTIYHMIVLAKARMAAAKSFSIFACPLLSLMFPNRRLFFSADDFPVR